MSLIIRSIKIGARGIKWARVLTDLAQRRFLRICRCMIRGNLRVKDSRIRIAGFRIGKVFRLLLIRISFRLKVC